VCCVCARTRACVCVCVRVRVRIHVYIEYVYVYVYIYILSGFVLFATEFLEERKGEEIFCSRGRKKEKPTQQQTAKIEQTYC